MIYVILAWSSLCIYRLKLLAQSHVLGDIKSESVVSCLSCILGKHRSLSFTANEYTSLTIFDLIHSDVWGSTPHPTMGGGGCW